MDKKKIFEYALLTVPIVILAIAFYISYHLQVRYLDKLSFNKNVAPFDRRLEDQEKYYLEEDFLKVHQKLRCACNENEKLVLRFNADASDIQNLKLVYVFKLLRGPTKTIQAIDQEDSLIFAKIKINAPQAFVMNLRFITKNDSTYLLDITNICLLLRKLDAKRETVSYR